MELDRPPSGTSDRPGAVLLLEDAPHGAANRLCGELLTVDDPSETGLVIVSLVQSPASRLSIWEEAATGWPAETVVVTVADDVEPASREPPGADVDVRTVSDPANLTRLGVTLTECLAAVDGTRPVLCFHSLSILLQYADLKQVFRFLSVLMNHLDAAGASAHFHLRPAVHDERTVATLRHLFDDEIRVGDR